MRYDLASPEWRLMQETADTLVARERTHGLGTLTPDEQTYFLVWIAEGEVGNGGMHAVCYNSTGNYIRGMAHAFNSLGATRKAALFKRLISAFGAEPPSEIHEARLTQHEALAESAVAEISSLDDAYFASEDVDHALYVLAQKIRQA
jgi:hypothetical protein